MPYPREPMPLHLMRHGTTGQPSYRGQIDDPLNELGWQQARAAADSGTWDLVVSSTLRRCSDFAREFCVQRGLPLQLDARLVEYHFGDWQGRTIADLERSEAAHLAAYRADPQRHPPPRGEDFDAFGRRIAAALDAVAVQRAGRALVITHGAVIRWVHCRLAGLPFGAIAETGIANASLHPTAWPASHTAAVDSRPDA